MTTQKDNNQDQIPLLLQTSTSVAELQKHDKSVMFKCEKITKEVQDRSFWGRLFARLFGGKAF